MELVGGAAFSANLTRHDSGAGYPRETSISVMHTGKGGSLHPIMPWLAFSGLTDADLGAMYDALGDVYPVAHFIGNTGEPAEFVRRQPVEARAPLLALGIRREAAFRRLAPGQRWVGAEQA